MSTVQRVAQGFGVGFVIAGFVAAGTSMEADPQVAPRAMGLFAVNLIHLSFGVWGLGAPLAYFGFTARQPLDRTIPM